MPTAPRPLLICTTARSGSNLLSDYLNNTGLFGRIAEYLNPHVVLNGWYGQKFGPFEQVNIADYLEYLRTHHASPAGQWGVKMLYEDVDNLIAFSEIQALLSDADVIFLRRRNKIAQAVSYYLAQETNQWLRTDVATKAPEDVPFSYERIDAAVKMFGVQEAYWTTLFARLKTRVHEIIYEDFVKDPGAALAAIAALMQVDGEIKVQTKIQPQASTRNRQLIEEYLQSRWSKLNSGAARVQYGRATFVGSGGG